MATLILPDDMRARLVAHRERFENAIDPQRDFFIVLAKYIDRECYEIHQRRLDLVTTAAAVRKAYPPPGEAQTLRGSGTSWRSDGIEELATLVGSEAAVDQFMMLVQAAGGDLPGELHPDKPFHEFDSPPVQRGFDRSGIWIEFLFHQLFQSGSCGYFIEEYDWPKPGCRITELTVNPFLASVMALNSVLGFDGDADNAGTKDEPKPGYLGLKFDDKRRLVFREGYDKSVDLSNSGLLYAILKALADSRDVPLSDDGLRGVWRRYGNEDNPQPGTISDAISEVRQRIRQLGLNVRRKRKLGYLFEAISDSTPN